MKWIKASERQPENSDDVFCLLKTKESSPNSKAQIEKAVCYWDGKKWNIQIPAHEYPANYWEGEWDVVEWLDESAFDIEKAINNLLTVDTLAIEKGVSSAAIYDMIKRGRLKSYVIGKKTVIMFRTEIQKYLNPSSDGNMLTTQEAAILRRVSVTAIQKAVKKGIIEGVKMGGKWFITSPSLSGKNKTYFEKSKK